MAIATPRRRAKRHPWATTAVLSVAAYALVVATFAGVLSYPDVSQATVDLLSHAIAVVNTGALALLVAGWWWIRQGEVARHRGAMVGATLLIVAFLVMYLFKVGGGGEKEIVGATGAVYYAYLGMLAVHILLSVLAVPLVAGALVLGLTHTPAELRESIHPRIGRAAATAWILSLALGVITYVMLNHVYDYQFVA